jgi:putative ABC transport system substrate-binding protein
MQRRDFITLLGAASALPAFSVARSQEVGRGHRIAILAVSRSEGVGWQAFYEALGRGGFVEGGNLQIDRRGFSVMVASLDTMATELVRGRPDVIVAIGPQAALAAQHATRSIAIAALADDLVTSGLVGSMSHPEGNMTGVAIFAFQLDVKRLELLHEALPKAGRIGILSDPDRKSAMDMLDRAAHDLGIEIVPFMARSNQELTDAIDAMKAQAVDAVNVLASPSLWAAHPLILDRLNLCRLPSIWQWSQGAEDGGLISYGPRLDGVFGQCGRLVVRLLQGAKVADTPVEQPTEIVLSINLKTAKALGVAIPPTLLSRADQLID